MGRKFLTIVGALCLGLSLASCGGADEDDAVPQTGKERRGQDNPGIFGEGGILGVFEDDKDKPGGGGGGGAGLGVNSFLWRATLDTISFMPVASADPFGGVVITDWHASQNAPDERFKLNVYILGQELRADGVVVRVFRQVDQNGEWVDVTVPGETNTKIEDAILTKARQLRHQSLTANQ